MKIEYICEKCGKISATSLEDVELKEDGTLIINGEKKTCHSCGNKKFSKVRRA